MPGAWHFGQQMRMSFELSTGVATIGLAGYRLVGESLRGTSREGRFLRNVEENTLVIVDSYPVFAEDGAARTAPQTAQQDMLVTPARMGVVSRHSIQLMSWPYQFP